MQSWTPEVAHASMRERRLPVFPVPMVGGVLTSCTRNTLKVRKPARILLVDIACPVALFVLRVVNVASVAIKRAAPSRPAPHLLQ